MCMQDGVKTPRTLKRCRMMKQKGSSAVTTKRLGLDGAGSGNTLGGELTLVETHNIGRGSLGNLGSGLAEQDLGVDGVALVRVDTTVSTVRATARLGCLLDDDVADDELLGLKALGLGVGLSVLEKGEEELDRLDGPSTW